MTSRGGGDPNNSMASMPSAEWARRLGASPSKRMTASWSGSNTDPTEYKVAARCFAPNGGLPSGRSHRELDIQIPIQGLLSVHLRCGLHTRTVTVCRDRYPKASDTSSPPCLLRSLPAGAVTGWGLHPLEKRRLVTAHVESRPWAATLGSTQLRRFRTSPVSRRNGEIPILIYLLKLAAKYSISSAACQRVSLMRFTAVIMPLWSMH